VSKYFKTKKGSIESAVLEAVSPAQQAAIAIAKKEKGEKPKNEEKVECPQCEGKGCDHCDGKGYHTTEELSAKQKKLDKNNNGKIDGDDLAALRKSAKKKQEEVQEETLAMKAAKHISDMWTEASKKDKVKDEEKEKKEEKHDGKTMTGKPANKIDVTPKSEEEEE